jgi:hypothetical protein
MTNEKPQLTFTKWRWKPSFPSHLISPLPTPQTPTLLPTFTANHLSCHAHASPWRANVSSCEEKTRPRWRDLYKGIRWQPWKPVRGTFTPSQSLAFCLAHGCYGAACGISANPPHAITYRLAHLAWKIEQLRLYKRLEGRASGWVFLVCGSWYILIMLFVCRKCVCNRPIDVQSMSMSILSHPIISLSASRHHLYSS